MEKFMKSSDRPLTHHLFQSPESGEELLQKIADAIPSVTCLYETGNQKISYINRQMTAILGYSYEDICRMDNDLLRLVPEADRARVQKQLVLYNRLKDNNGSPFECRLLLKEGGWQYFRITGTVIFRNNDDTPAAILFVANDLTALQQKEKEVSRLRQVQHEKKLEDNIRELNRSNRELEEFAYVASHDLQEPLRKLSTFTERLADRCAGKLNEEGMVYIDRILAATDNMRVLIDNLLEFSRVTRSQTPFGPVDLNEILSNTRNDFELNIEETGAQILNDPLPVISGIGPQLQQLFNNLLSNAIKFHRPGSKPRVDVSVKGLSQNAKLSLHLPARKKYFKIEVQDNGIGFEQEYAERIFQIFQRLHGKVEFPGSGVGLAICKKITENHGGLIYATGKPEQGAVFTIILPETHL